MGSTLNLLCLFGISAILFVDHAEARSIRRLEGEGIRGGTYAQEGQFPYHMSLEFNGQSFCGASILSERFAITAAHCVTNDDGSFMDVPLKVVAGTNDLESESKSKVAVDVFKVYVPKEYQPTLLKRKLEPFGDIAILELNKKLDIEANSKLGKVNLPKINEPNYEGKKAVISGFGLNEVKIIFDENTRKKIEIDGDGDNKLRFAEAEMMNNQDCQDRHGNSLRITKDKHLCAALVQRDADKPEGLCTGDSGGGLIYDGTIIGIASSSPHGCREDKRPAVYTRVSQYLSFINNVLDSKIDKSIRTTNVYIIAS